MAFTKSTVATDNISNLPDKPLISATALKAAFDKYGADDVPYINGLIDELEKTTATSGAENIGSRTISGITGNTVWAQISNVFTQLYANFLSKTNTTAYTPTVATHPATKGYVDTTVSGVILGQIPDDSLTNAKLGTDIKIGSVAALATTDKSAVVPAINEIKTYVDGLILGTDITLYVDGTLGSDLNDGLSPGAGAKQTIQAAIDSLPKQLEANATINVAAGTYLESVNIEGFTGFGLIEIAGAATRTTTHTATNFIINGCTCSVYVSGFVATTSGQVGFSVSNSSKVLIFYCTCSNVDASKEGAVIGYSNVYMLDCEFSNRFRGIYASQTANIGISNVIGTGNTTGIVARYGGLIGLYGAANTITGTQDKDVYGGIIISNNGNPFRTGTPLPATTGTMTATMDGEVKKITPTGSCTFNASNDGNLGEHCSFVILTSGTSSYNMTFGTRFKSTGVLATGTVTAKTFTVNFVNDGTNWVETSRTAAM